MSLDVLIPRLFLKLFKQLYNGMISLGVHKFIANVCRL